MAYTVEELSLKTYGDFETLAEEQGECWCMYYQREKPVRGFSLKEWKAVNRRDKRKFVKEGRAHAIIVYDGGTPVGWCQYGPRDELPRIDASRFYKKMAQTSNAEHLWRITCFFVARDHRKKGVAKAALAGALKSIRREGGGVVEAYPVVSKRMAAVPEWLWFGTPSMFAAEGFDRVAPLGTSRVLMRKKVGP